MRVEIKKYVAAIDDAWPLEGPVYEFGSYQVQGQEGFADLRPLFPGKVYVGCDMRPGPGVDLVTDLTCLSVESQTAGAALILDTLEHVELLGPAIAEIHRVLKPGGVVLASSVMNFPIHDYPSDFWRFTPEGFKSLFGTFAWVRVDALGDPLFPHTVVAVAKKDEAPTAEQQMALAHALEEWKSNFLPPRKSPLRRFGRAIVPPIFLPLVRTLYVLWGKITKNSGRNQTTKRA